MLSENIKKIIKEVFKDIDLRLFMIMQLKRQFQNVGYISMIKREKNDPINIQTQKQLDELNPKHTLEKMKILFELIK